jgi:hypothetical protein
VEAFGDPERRDVMSEQSESGSVVVLEEGADWPKWIAEYQRHATNSVVVAYAPGEPLDDFVARVGRRLSELTEELTVAIVACAGKVEPERLAARERICHKLLDAMAAQGRGEVLLAASVEASEESRHAIFELAGDLCDGLRGSSRVVRVRFSSGRPESGIMSKVPTTEIDHPLYRAISEPRR